jgi:tetratricopeptide (TPR) repeat protein
MLHNVFALTKVKIDVAPSLKLAKHREAIDPKNVDVLTDKGIALNNIGNYTGAITYYDKALAIDPKNVDVLTDKGIALNNIGNYTGAITYYDKALAIDPKYIYAINDKGIALNDLGNYTRPT